MHYRLSDVVWSYYDINMIKIILISFSISEGPLLSVSSNTF